MADVVHEALNIGLLEWKVAGWRNRPVGLTIQETCYFMFEEFLQTRNDLPDILTLHIVEAPPGSPCVDGVIESLRKHGYIWIGQIADTEAKKYSSILMVFKWTECTHKVQMVRSRQIAPRKREPTKQILEVTLVIENSAGRQRRLSIWGANLARSEAKRLAQVRSLRLPQHPLLLFGDLNFRLRLDSVVIEVAPGTKTWKLPKRKKLSSEQVWRICEALSLPGGPDRFFACDTLTPSDDTQPLPSAVHLTTLGLYFPIPTSLPLPTYKRMPGYVPESNPLALKKAFFELREYGATQTLCRCERFPDQDEYLLQMGWLDRVGWARAPGTRLVHYSTSSRVQLSDHAATFMQVLFPDSSQSDCHACDYSRQASMSSASTADSLPSDAGEDFPSLEDDEGEDSPSEDDNSF